MIGEARQSLPSAAPQTDGRIKPLSLKEITDEKIIQSFRPRGTYAYSPRGQCFDPRRRRVGGECSTKYHNIAQAEADGYVNIDVFVSGQGFHYLNPAPDVLDATFEADKPEILVYAPMPLENSLRLVAVEYAVPIALSPNGPPEGFTGNDDVWDRNEEFGLWTLHAWVWLNNPNGMFAEFSPRVP